MANGIDMTVNELPAATWNWLKLNRTKLSDITAAGVHEETARIPEGLQTETGAAAVLTDIPTGMGADLDRLAELAGTKTRRFTVREQECISEAVKLDYEYADGEQAMNRVEIEAKAGSSVTVIMDYRSEKQAVGLAAIQTRIRAEKDAKVCLVQIERLGDGFTCLNDIGIDGDDRASVHVIHAVLGGKDVYQGCRMELRGKASAFGADVAYLGTGDRRLDMNYVAHHTGKNTVSEINSSGVLRDRTFKVFRGTIDFVRGASGARGDEKEDVLLLDDGVVNQTIPLILCAEEDVEGNHGATIGQLDEELLFYLESRGMSEEAIYEMMAKAKIDAVCRLIPDRETVESIEAYLEGGEKE